MHPRYWGRIAESIGLALVIGGILALGPLVAPVLFHEVPVMLAAKVMSTIFMRFDVVLTIALALVLVGELIQLRYGSWVHGISARLRTVFALVMVTLLIGSVFVVNPKLQAFQQQGVMRWVGEQGRALDQAHHTAEGMMKAELTLGVLALILLGLPIPHMKRASDAPA